MSRGKKIGILLGLAAFFVITGFGLYWFWPPQDLPRADKVIVIKSERVLQVMKNGKRLETYRIALGRNPEGHKTRQGDRKTPEGNYILDWRNPQSKYHLSIHISYPNASDIRNARTRGVSPGGDIMIHGQPPERRWLRRFQRLLCGDWTDGCIAVTNREMEEIWRSVPDGTPMEIRP